MSVIALPSSIKDVSSQIAFELIRSQERLQTTAGVTQITAFPDRRWRTTVQVNPQWASDLREWSLFLTQISDLSNVFAMGPPQYDGPSTGYSGSTPLVAGGSQLGTSLDVDGLGTSANVLLAGDFISFDVTSGGGNTNRQLIQVASDVSSDGSGDATIELTVPIRQAPADNAAVNIATPTAFFMLVEPTGGVQMRAGGFSEFVLDAIERIFP